MAETLESRQSVQDALEDIENTLVAASTRLAQVQLDTLDDVAVSDIAANAMNDLSPIIETIESLRSEYQIETNRKANEGELD